MLWNEHIHSITDEFVIYVCENSRKIEEYFDFRKT